MKKQCTPPVPAEPAVRWAVIYARVSSRGTGEGGLFHPVPVKMLTDCAAHEGLAVVLECISTWETAKTAGRTSFGSMVV